MCSAGAVAQTTDASGLVILAENNTPFAHLGKAIDAIGEPTVKAKASPISPLPASKTTSLALTVEALIHAF